MFTLSIILTTVLMVLKLGGIITFSWWLILSTPAITFLIYLLLLCVTVSFVIILRRYGVR